MNYGEPHQLAIRTRSETRRVRAKKQDSDIVALDRPEFPVTVIVRARGCAERVGGESGLIGLPVPAAASADASVGNYLSDLGLNV